MRFVRKGLLILCILFMMPATNFAGLEINATETMDTETERYSISSSSTIIANHNNAKLADLLAIPDEWITKARTDLHIYYNHTSHGSQVADGMSGLASFKGNKYAWNGSGSGGALHFGDTYSTDLGNGSWPAITENYLKSHLSTNVVMWSWCGQVSSASSADITNYLNAMNQLEIKYPAVKFVYMTGHTDGSGVNGILNTRNEQIRTYCKNNNKVLFDFADIESYDPCGKYYLNKAVDDGCAYDSDGNGSRDENWATDWQASHTENVDWYSCGSAHSQPVNANMKAYAAWYMWARIAGWDGGAAGGGSNKETVGDAVKETAGDDVKETGAGIAATDVSTTFESGKTPNKIIHVSVMGNDSSGNGSAGLPYKTIERAVREAKPGTAVRIHQGTYVTRVNISGLAGMAQAPIWIGGAKGEKKPVITNTSEGIHLTKVHYLILHDMEITKTYDNGINCDDGGEYANSGATRHIVFRNLYIHHIGSSGNQDGLKLSGVNSYYVLDSIFTSCGGDQGSGIDQVGCHNGVIANNNFHDLNGNAIQCKGGSENIEISRNTMTECGERAINIGGSSGFEYFRPVLSRTAVNYEAKNIRISSNLIKGGIASLAFVGATNCSVVNNTIITPHNWILRILQETRRTSQYTFGLCANNTIVNNIFYYDGADLLTQINIGNSTLPKTFTFSNNLWYNYTSPKNSKPSLPVAETNGIYGRDPLFTGLASNNIGLSTKSPALAKGIKISTIKFDNKGKLFNNPPSIGAVEGQSQ